MHARSKSGAQLAQHNIAQCNTYKVRKVQRRALIRRGETKPEGVACRFVQNPRYAWDYLHRRSTWHSRSEQGVPQPCSAPNTTYEETMNTRIQHNPASAGRCELNSRQGASPIAADVRTGPPTPTTTTIALRCLKMGRAEHRQCGADIPNKPHRATLKTPEPTWCPNNVTRSQLRQPILRSVVPHPLVTLSHFRHPSPMSPNIQGVDGERHFMDFTP